MPFLTEELWQQTGEGEAQLMTLAPWPRFADSLVDAEADATLGWVVRVIGQIRAVRSEMNVPPGARIALIVNDASTDSKARLADHEALVKTLARVETIAFDQPVPKGSVQDVLDECRSEEHTSELQSLMRISYAVFCMKKKTIRTRP